MAMSFKYRERKLEATNERETLIRTFLYDEGPHTAQELIKHFGWSSDHTMKLLNSMQHEGVLEKARLRNNIKWYWLLVDETG